MPQQTLTQPTTAQKSTCATCLKFQDYQDRERGLCEVFDKVTRSHHTQTSDCQQQLESSQLQELLDQYQAFLKPVINGFPGRYVYKQAPDYAYDRICYVGENLVGWFAQDRHGFLVIEQQPSQLKALEILLKR